MAIKVRKFVFGTLALGMFAGIAATAAILAAGTTHADQFVNGYYRQNGTYVQPYLRTTPDASPFNNYSTYPNINPYTGHLGTVNPYAAPTPNYGSGRTFNPYGFR